jgi:His-Xaa-Ser system protein HxsD
MAHPMTTNIVAGSVTAEANTKSYSLMAMKKAAYRVAAQCTVIFGEVLPGGSVRLEFVPAAGSSDDVLSAAIPAFFREANDYDLREKIAAETAPLRNLILAHAFSRTRLSETASE